MIDDPRHLPPPAGGAVPLPPPPTPSHGDSLVDGEWHRMHPLTPLLRGGLFLVVVLGIVVANLRDRLIAIFVPLLGEELPPGAEFESGDPVDFVLSHDLVLVAVVLVAAVLVVLVAGFYVSWRFHTFRVTGDDVEVRHGILFRTHRRAPLDRVQGVNLTRPFLARLAGLAKLEVVGAGLDANVKLEYLTTANAEQVRADILRLASGRRLGERPGGPRTASRTAAVAAAVSDGITGLIAGAEEPAAEPESVVHIPVGRLVASHVLSPSTVGLLVAIAAVIVGSVVGTPWLLFAMVPTILAFGTFWVSRIVKSLRYSIAPTANGLRITFGLFTTVTEILPPGRIHSVEIGQSILWRPFGWWRIRINRITGRSAADAASDQFTTVLPVGTRADVERVLRLLMPDESEQQRAFIFEHGILGPVADDLYRNTPARARILRPLSWRRNGFAMSDGALLLRRGVVWRNVAVFPFARLQSVGLTQGPLRRALAVASLQIHTVPGPVSNELGAIDRDAALELFGRIEERAVAAAASDRSHRWAAGAADEDALPPASGGVQPGEAVR